MTPGSIRRPLVIAHRGDSAHAPENTLPAFEAAVAKGADCIELDLLLSHDGEVVVCHDPVLTRLAGGRQRVRDLDAAELARVDVGGRLFPRFAGTGIPALAVVLERVGTRLPLCLELKSCGHGRREADNRRLLARCLQLVPRRSAHALASFDAGLVRGVLEAGRKAVLIVSEAAALRRLAPRELSALHAVSAAHDLLDEEFVRRVVRADVPLWVWTVDGERAVRRALAWGASAICGNDVAANRALIDRLWHVGSGAERAGAGPAGTGRAGTGRAGTRRSP
jgi:glycerophosphoryl diester phosphodiesterase